jgi:Domain of unknown function (DUF4338)
MVSDWVIQGRHLGAPDLEQIRILQAANPSWFRTRLSRELCQLWEWRNEAGQFKDMACRTLLLKLEARGFIGLPPRQAAANNGWRNRSPAAMAHDTSVVQSPLAALGPLHVELVASGSAQAKLFQFLLHRYHYLGHRNCVGENLKYLACDRGGRPLACVLFGSAAWKCQARDAFIGWSAAQRQRHLRLLTNNTRLLVLPWVHVPDLASHLLSRIARRLSRDWQAKYGHRIHLLESFVQADRFLGHCYQAAGWIALGTTTGRGRNAPGPAPQGPVKGIYVRALSPDWAQRLCA